MKKKQNKFTTKQYNSAIASRIRTIHFFQCLSSHYIKKQLEIMEAIGPSRLIHVGTLVCLFSATSILQAMFPLYIIDKFN